MQVERRSTKRIRLNVRARWETLLTQGRGSVCDLSSNGCFVLTGGEVTPRELVRLELQPSEKVVVIWGEVVYSIPEMGFALRFRFYSPESKYDIESLLEEIDS